MERGKQGVHNNIIYIQALIWWSVLRKCLSLKILCNFRLRKKCDAWNSEPYHRNNSYQEHGVQLLQAFSDGKI